MKRIIPRDGWEWAWTVLIFIIIGLAIGHAAQHHWVYASLALAVDGMACTIAVFRRGVIDAEKKVQDGRYWSRRALRAEADLRLAGLRISCRLPDATPVFHRQDTIKPRDVLDALSASGPGLYAEGPDWSNVILDGHSDLDKAAHHLNQLWKDQQ